MGKKTRKTRWRALAIADESDSEESNTLSGSQLSKNYHHRPFYSKFTYSSQSTPTRRFPYEPKSTRSSSTASETKITFNEDEYTKITTPRQDVLFKKGYLNKPKTYQTQTSTGNSTASTGNSTGNGTPDHQSADGTEGTDLEYESQFVFPNAFVDQNGIYYINSYEHYPLLMYNPTICYPEYPSSRTKRHSTGSLTESTSPHTEETSQDLSQSGGENTGNGPELNHVYNVIYPGYYFNGVCSPNVTTNGQAATEPRKIKKKRRRKISKSVNQDDSTTSEDGYSSDEAITQVENRVENTKTTISCNGSISTSETTVCLRLDEGSTSKETEEKKISDEKPDRLQNSDEDNKETISETILPAQSTKETTDEDTAETTSTPKQIAENKVEVQSTEETNKNTEEDKASDQNSSNIETEPLQETTENHVGENDGSVQENDNQNITDNSEETIKESKFNLNAEEFVPRAYRNVEPLPVDPNVQFINIHPNFVPLPLMNHPELNAPPFNPQFLPPGIPLNLMPADPKLLPNFINFVPNHFIPMKPFEQPPTTNELKATEETTKENNDEEKKAPAEVKTETPEIDNLPKENSEKHEKNEESIDVEKPKPTVFKNDVDIAKIVSKLEEAAKEQKIFENRRQNFRSPNKFNKTPRPRYNSPYEKSYQAEYKQPLDKRRPRRYENKPNESPDAKPKETTDSQRETTQHSESHQIKTKEVQTDLQIKTEIREIPSKSNEDEKKYSPRHQNYKPHNSPRRYINYNNKNTRGRTPEMSYSASPNYSETVKKPPYGKSRFEKHSTEKSNNFVKPTTTVKRIEEPAKEINKIIPISGKTSQWISVSNRKKRKNKSTTDDENEIVDEASFETTEEVFDIREIAETKEDVIETTDKINTIKNIEKTESLSIGNIDNLIEMIVSKESSPIKICSNTDISNNQILLQDVKDIEKELLKECMKVEIVQDTVDDIPELNLIESLPNQLKSTKDTTKKKSKKGNQKNTTKRIIILDPDVSKKENEKPDKPKSKVDTEKPTIEDSKPKEIIAEPVKIETEKNISISETVTDATPTANTLKEDIKNNSLLPPLEVSTDNASTPDKKKSKKKKKQTKATLIANVSSVSSSSTTLNNMDDSYDFLLDTTALVDEKTNIEVSEELDKMIQKGLFGNLEEKFRSLNVSVDDDFFKSLNIKPKAQSTQDKGFIKATNFTTILNNTNQALPRTNVTEDQNKIDIDFSKIKLPDYEPQPSTSKTGNFLEEPILNVEPETQVHKEVILNTKSNGKLKNKSKKNVVLVENETNQQIDSTDKDIFKNDPKNEVVLKNEESFLEEDKSVSDTERPLIDSLPKNDDVIDENSSKNDEIIQCNGVSENAMCLEMEDDKEKKAVDNDTHDITSGEPDVASSEIFEHKEVINCEYDTKEDTKKFDDTQASEIQGVYVSCNGYYNGEHSIDNTDENELNKEMLRKECSQLDTKISEKQYLNTDFFKNNLTETEMEQHIIIKIENECMGNEIKHQNDENTAVRQSITIEIEDDKSYSLESSAKSEESLEEVSTKSTEDPKPLYPITQAVREWMTKTRETTPEIELLKSPDTIYKEFIGNSDEDDSDTETDQKNCKSNPSSVEYLDQGKICHNSMDARVANKSDSEDEITVFETWSMSQDTSTQDDLLDCWEPEIIEEQKGISKELKKRNDSIEQGEDVLAVYESKYGKNEDFLRLKAEIEDQKKNGNFPKHGNLPYRAICCSLM